MVAPKLWEIGELEYMWVMDDYKANAICVAKISAFIVSGIGFIALSGFLTVWLVDALIAVKMDWGPTVLIVLLKLITGIIGTVGIWIALYCFTGFVGYKLFGPEWLEWEKTAWDH